MIQPADCYRLPWSLNDNVLAWLEPTKACNLYCEGCYSRNDPKSHKSLDQVRADMDVFVAHRNVDSISIAGGDPLTHPDVVDIVRIITHDYGLKAVINTNGLALDRDLVLKLRDAGLTGFTFHIDSSQGRPGHKGWSEPQLNELRLHYARMVADAGGMSVAFNCTVFPHTLEHVPAVLEWGREHIDLVHSLVFILFRTTRSSEFSYFANGTPVDADEDLVYYGEEKNPKVLQAHDVLAKIHEVDPAFTPSAYLGGTRDPESFKWLLTGRIGSAKGIEAYVGPRYMELVQNVHHMATGKYLGYVHPDLLAHGRSMMLGLAPFDARLRKATARWVAGNLVAPWRWGRKLHFQSVLIIQPIDMMPDGEMNMCDGCPDMTVHDGQLVWSCRLDERQQYGCFLTAAPRGAVAEAK